ncbi:hypothetical protein A0128_20865 [Leptospira tipperaryensis]|uniref:Thioredoxin domain-containing protein n=1 Tax=Leptospira tipperaryensis TaxID=2564040 RepID=A0A1D7V3P9_9LEPT|nr:SCO family protein [Leptospira tipperaryensis]AOP36467.1 hypothetical protein A0128_20865 [Leptospira tipperaryensis]
MNLYPIVSKSISALIIAVCLYFVLAANPFVVRDQTHRDSGMKVDRELPAFQIRNGENFVITDTDLYGRKYLIYFGYGDCKSVCRTGISKLETLLSKEEFSSWNLALISLDPEKDREKQSWMRKYLSRWKREPILLLPKDRKDAEKIAALFQVSVSAGFEESIVHQNPLFVVDETGKIRVVYPDLSGFSEESLHKLSAKVY